MSASYALLLLFGGGQAAIELAGTALLELNATATLVAGTPEPVIAVYPARSRHAAYPGRDRYSTYPARRRDAVLTERA